jgi:hypothetical protein
VFLLQVVTIVTVQVADGTSRFGKNLKFSGSFDHYPILHLRGECYKALDLIRTRFFWEEYRGIKVVGQEKGSTSKPICADRNYEAYLSINYYKKNKKLDIM